MSQDHPELTTSRLLLRRPRIEDFDAYAGFMSDERSARFVGGVQSRSVAWRGFVALAGAWELQGFSMFSVMRRDTGAWIGRVGPWMPEGWPGTEVGWGISPSHWNQGFATEAARAAIDWAFDVLKWREVIHVIDPANAASIAVAEKLGSRNRGAGRLPDPYQDVTVDIWGQTRAQWQAAGTT
ncbi:MAG: GNAT family N-acetyltransferase [Gammaproteobacteria bacterium]